MPKSLHEQRTRLGAPKRKDAAVETLRGLAVILMVAGHVVGTTSSRGLQVPDDSFWRYSYQALQDVRMPLFTVISGFVYGLRPLPRGGDVRKLVKGKARRLLVPLFVVGSIFFVFQLVVPGTNSRPEPSQLWQVYVYGYEHFWFLQAIFLIFVVIACLDHLGAFDRPSGWFAVFAVAAGLHILVRVSSDADVFDVNGAFRLLPFFVLGYALTRHDLRRCLVPVLLLGVVAFGVKLWVIVEQPDLRGTVTRALGFVVGTTAVLLLFWSRRQLCNAPLAWIGQFAFAIYLLHVFGAAGGRILLKGVGVTDPFLLFPACLLLAIGLPIVFQLVAGRFELPSRLFLGQRPVRPTTFAELKR